MIEQVYLLRLALALVLGFSIGIERETQDKPAGLRTIMIITFGAALMMVFSLKLLNISQVSNMDFDLIRGVAYWVVAVGFGTGVYKSSKNIEGITTAAVILTMPVIGFLCGIGEYSLATLSTLAIYFILKLKYIRVKITKINNTKRKNYVKRKNSNY